LKYLRITTATTGLAISH